MSITPHIPITFMTREELEAKLGNRDAFIITPENKATVIEWANRVGYEPVEIHAMSSVQLANLYHREGPAAASLDIARITSEAIRLTVEALAKPVDQETIGAMVAQALAELAPRRLEIITNGSSVILDCPTHYITPKVIGEISLGHHVMLVGPAGCGKTTIGEHTAKALQLPFFITSTITDTHELMGFIDGYGNYRTTAFRNAFEHGGIWIADEIDAWEPGPLLAANSALANGFATFPDIPSPVRRHADFRMVATANTFGNGADRVYVGRNELDAASLDRFATINVDYDLSLERMFARGSDRWLENVWRVRRIVQEKKIRHVVSSRAIIFGAASLARGTTWDDVEDFYLFKGMSAADRSKIDG